MKNKHRGSNFDEFLKEDGIYDECHAEAVKRAKFFEDLRTGLEEALTYEKGKATLRTKSL